MIFNKNNCNKVIELLTKDKNNDEGYEQFMELLEEYLKKYSLQNLDDNLDLKLFKSDTKLIFSIIKLVFCDDEIIKELSDESSKHFDIKELLEYMDFVKNINLVNNNIDEYNNKNDQINNSINKVIIFLNKKQEDIKKLNDTMSNLNDTLDKLHSTLSQMNDL
jgi:methyl-accepting chemotaxis protein